MKMVHAGIEKVKETYRTLYETYALKEKQGKDGFEAGQKAGEWQRACEMLGVDTAEIRREVLNKIYDGDEV